MVTREGLDILNFVWAECLSEAQLGDELAHGWPARRFQLMAEIRRDARAESTTLPL